MIVIRNNILPIGRRYGAINIFGIVFAKRGFSITPEVLNHERIHTAQMRELLYVAFYICYVAEWLWHIAATRGKLYDAYRRVTFEREAYAHDHDLNYLSKRRHYSQWR